MRVTLVGGLGFIGHHLACELAGHDVQIIDNLMWNNIVTNAMQPDSFTKRLNRRFFDLRFEAVQGCLLENVDARDENGLWNALDRFEPDHIVHLSAISSSVDARAVPGLCYDLQLNTLKNVLEYARRKGAGVTFLSSSTVYGDFKTPTVDESVRPQPVGIYASTKYMGERLVRCYSDQYGISSNIIRPSALYGERCVSRRVSQVFIENALLGKPLLLEGGGDGRLDFTYIGDLVTGIRLAIEKTSGTNTYNLTYGNSRSIRELAEIVQKVVPDVILEDRPRAELKPVRGTLCTKRAEEKLGFKPRYPLRAGYHNYCLWYRDQYENCIR